MHVNSTCTLFVPYSPILVPYSLVHVHVHVNGHGAVEKSTSSALALNLMEAGLLQLQDGSHPTRPDSHHRFTGRVVRDRALWH